MTTNIDRGHLWLFKDHTSFDTLPTADVFESYMKAILICANGDGKLTSEERDWVIGYMAAFGAPDSLLDEMRSYKANDDIEAVISATPASDASRRFLVYDAIRACSADGAYSDPERATVIKMAAKLGISEDLVKQIEEVCLEQAKLRQKRLALMYPEGAPL
jgi:hypothetical protein